MAERLFDFAEDRGVFINRVNTRERVKAEAAYYYRLGRKDDTEAHALQEDRLVLIHRIAGREEARAVNDFQYRTHHRQRLAFRVVQHSRDIERENAHKRKMNREKHQRVIDFLGGKCARCGFSDYRALQIDHINGGGVRERKTTPWDRLLKRVMALGKSTYQVLCANCNWIKKHENSEGMGPRSKA